jgi:hypothetical protein
MEVAAQAMEVEAVLVAVVEVVPVTIVEVAPIVVEKLHLLIIHQAQVIPQVEVVLNQAEVVVL